jgi:hypothetical protein
MSGSRGRLARRARQVRETRHAVGGTTLAKGPGMTRLVALVLCLVLGASAARADDLVDAEIHARRMRKSGAGVMGVGLIHLGAGLALTFAMVGMEQQCRGYSPECGEGIGFLLFPMIGLVGVGGVLTAIGMPLYFVGRHRERRLLQALTPTPIGQLTPVPPMPQ